MKYYSSCRSATGCIDNHVFFMVLLDGTSVIMNEGWKAIAVSPCIARSSSNMHRLQLITLPWLFPIPQLHNSKVSYATLAYCAKYFKLPLWLTNH